MLAARSNPIRSGLPTGNGLSGADFTADQPTHGPATRRPRFVSQPPPLPLPRPGRSLFTLRQSNLLTPPNRGDRHDYQCGSRCRPSPQSRDHPSTETRGFHSSDRPRSWVCRLAIRPTPSRHRAWWPCAITGRPRGSQRHDPNDSRLRRPARKGTPACGIGTFGATKTIRPPAKRLGQPNMNSAPPNR